MITSDISVFWQEIIDTYRDMMVVKNSRSAKTYLDLTELEYEKLLNLSKEFTMAKMAYHVRLLEDALGDMQRAQNAKRGIAEITLTRMCDPTSVSSPEAFALRIEELEREIKMLKAGVTVSVSDTVPDDKKAVAKASNPAQGTKSDEPVKTAKTTVNANNSVQNTNKNTGTEFKELGAWSNVLEYLSSIKPPLAAQLRSSRAYGDGHGSFVVRMSGAFIASLSNNVPSMMLIKSAIAEQLRCPVSEIKNISLEANKTQSANDLQRELEDALR
jgi:hypothetical protein